MTDRKTYPYFRRFSSSVLLTIISCLAYNAVALLLTYIRKGDPDIVDLDFVDFQFFFNGESVGIDFMSIFGLFVFVLLTGVFYSFQNRHSEIDKRVHSPIELSTSTTDPSIPSHHHE